LTGGPPAERAGLYVHVPFCSAICPYCDFAVRTGRPRDLERYLRALLAEVLLWSQEGFAFDTVYFGGGTPSLLETEALAHLLESVHEALAVETGAPVFLEANPEDVDRERLAAWREMGVRFLSLGVQTFDGAALRFLGRRHTPDQARRAAERALEAGFETVSLDLIYGLPDQGTESWRRDLENAVRLGPQHLSCYQLTVHEGTHFGRLRERGRLPESPRGAQADLFLLTHTVLEEAGLPGYEVSNFAAAPEHRSRHNEKYWTHAPYLGLGPSAHSFRGARRWWNDRDWRDWADHLDQGRRPVAGSERLDRGQLALEAFMLGMRRREGTDLVRFRERYGVDLEQRNGALFSRLEEEGLVHREGDRLVPTLHGLAVADSLARDIQVG